MTIPATINAANILKRAINKARKEGRLRTFEELLQGTLLDPRPYQNRICNKVFTNWWDKLLRSQMIESATGSGKTSMALTICKGINIAFGDDVEIGWVAMRQNLLTQARKENGPRQQVATTKDGAPVYKGMNINAKVNFLSMFTKNIPDRLLADHKDAAKIRILIVDEGQHDGADTMAHLHAIIRPHLILSMSATPYRSDSVKLCFDTIIKDSSLGTLIRDGWLAPYHHYTVPRWNPKEIAAHYLANPERWGKSIFYWHTTQQCLEFLGHIAAAGVTTFELVKQDPKERDEQLERFNAGTIDGLVNCMLLVEGFDCPDLKTAWVRPSCKGVTVQMCGRAFRKHPNVPYKQIVQARKGWPFMKLTEPKEQYIWQDDMWMSLKVNPKIDALQIEMFKAIASANVRQPEYLRKMAFKKRGRARRNRAR